VVQSQGAGRGGAVCESILSLSALDRKYAFVMPSALALSAASREAARVLGRQVREGRLRRRWTVKDLAARVGVSEVTLRKVERGDPSVALGTAFEAASLVGVVLYVDPDRRAAEDRRLGETLALLPAAARRVRPVDDDF
jgi:DNA-binding XRE family transcriptional regulator